eukprot:707959-Hanusia_phi.AAC.1
MELRKEARREKLPDRIEKVRPGYASLKVNYPIRFKQLKSQSKARKFVLRGSVTNFTNHFAGTNYHSLRASESNSARKFAGVANFWHEIHIKRSILVEVCEVRQ